MNIGIIIQARMGSTRYPGKVLKKLYKDKTILDICIESLRSLNYKIIIATTTKKEDELIIRIAKSNKLDYYCGNENDVLQRYIDCAIELDISKIIRVTSDNIFLQPSLISPLIEYDHSDLDYISYKINNKNVVLTHWGFFGEYVTLEALKKVKSLTKDKMDLENVTYYIYHHPDKFNIELWDVPKELNRNDIRLTIDTVEDFNICQKIFIFLKQNDLEPNYQNILEYLNKNPGILEEMKAQIN
ncbi:unnamed protein product [marine sediment metagenome]|uniref:Acylneuraminate cytidylyltransferase n=1 Tax=marine sediment metagenome TaxID=412755 RepID=X1T947_9ZZZZ